MGTACCFKKPLKSIFLILPRVETARHTVLSFRKSNAIPLLRSNLEDSSDGSNVLWRRDHRPKDNSDENALDVNLV